MSANNCRSGELFRSLNDVLFQSYRFIIGPSPSRKGSIICVTTRESCYDKLQVLLRPPTIPPGSARTTLSARFGAICARTPSVPHHALTKTSLDLSTSREIDVEDDRNVFFNARFLYFVKIFYNVWGLACILGLTSSNRQISRTSELARNVTPYRNGAPPHRVGKAQ